MNCGFFLHAFVTEGGASNQSWRWALPNVNTYATLVRGLAASLRVSDAIEIVESVRRHGVPAGDEVQLNNSRIAVRSKLAQA